jgi:hypothetical protein
VVDGAPNERRREGSGWPGVALERKEQGPGGIGVTVYRLGRAQIAHVHGDGQADCLVPPGVREEWLRAGRAVPHPAFPDERTAATVQIRGSADVPAALGLFHLNYGRLREAVARPAGRGATPGRG